MSGEIMAVGRSADSIAMEIQVIVRQAHRVVCSAAIEIGERLIEAKKLVPHGEWEGYVQDRCGFKPRTAQAYMQIAADREKAQTFADLEFSKVLLLLAMPEGQAEALTAEHDPQTMSVRELKAQIAAEKERAEKAEIDTAALREQLAVAQEEIGAAHQKEADWQKQARDWQDKNSEDKKVERKLRADVTALETELAAARAQAGKVSPSEMVEIRDQARQEAEQIVAESHRADLAVCAATIERLKAELQRAQEAAEQGDEQKTLISIVQDAVGQVGEKLNVLQGHYLKVKATNPKLAEAIRSLVSRQIYLMYERFDIEPV